MKGGFGQKNNPLRFNFVNIKLTKSTPGGVCLQLMPADIIFSSHIA